LPYLTSEVGMIVRLSYNIIIVVDNIDLDKNINDASRKKKQRKG
jgi:hypothetical protein